MQDKPIENKKVINIKTGQPIFSEWLKDVLKQNDFSNAHSAILMWSTEEGGNWARLNLDTKELKYYSLMLQDKLFEYSLEEFLQKRIKDFIEYIEE